MRDRKGKSKNFTPTTQHPKSCPIKPWCSECSQGVKEPLGPVASALASPQKLITRILSQTNPTLRTSRTSGVLAICFHMPSREFYCSLSCNPLSSSSQVLDRSKLAHVSATQKQICNKNGVHTHWACSAGLEVPWQLLQALLVAKDQMPTATSAT